MMKKLLLTFAMILAAMTASAQNYDFSYETDGVTYYYKYLNKDGDNSTVELTPQYPYNSSSYEYGMYDYETITIPATVSDGTNTCTVTSIGKGAFYSCESIKSVSLPSTITSIGYEAFAYCTNLASFAGNLATADHRCLIIDGTLVGFASAGLTSYSFPEGITKIEEYTCGSCYEIEEIVFPETLQEMGDYTFNDYSKLSVLSFLNPSPIVIDWGAIVFGELNSLKSWSQALLLKLTRIIGLNTVI